MTRNRSICIQVGMALVLSQLLLIYMHHSSMRILRVDTEMTVIPMRSGNLSGRNLTRTRVTFTHSSSTVPQRQRVLLHLHIGKNGGTSLDGLGKRLAKETFRQFIGYRHFDWSYIDSLSTKVDVITMLRNPVERAVSHFSSAQLWMKQLQHFRNLTLGDYLHNSNLLLQTRSIWFDGQAGVSWLTGTHTEDWVVGKLNASELSRRQDLYEKNATELCLLAAERLDETLWFGILEDLPKSMALLQHSLRLEETPLLPRGNANPRHATQPRVLSEWESEAIASLEPMDMWLYQYGKRLMQARLDAIQTGTFVPPERPPLPKVWSCVSTSTSLDCKEGPLKGSYWLKRHSSMLIRKNGPK
mmetsp:Transcript_5253/g.9651  ORF Transcript_5253/g.9651 Transcript_5253/m.9651 type:complete len:357 (+) Transcript_5253:114-1184(+)